eukprot:Amastigsp_a847030_6.p5 type:complete len:116 gc:universal Amastigsp_a847030_6:1087-1434(+)
MRAPRPCAERRSLFRSRRQAPRPRPGARSGQAARLQSPLRHLRPPSPSSAQPEDPTPQQQAHDGLQGQADGRPRAQRPRPHTRGSARQTQGVQRASVRTPRCPKATECRRCEALH